MDITLMKRVAHGYGASSEDEYLTKAVWISDALSPQEGLHIIDGDLEATIIAMSYDVGNRILMCWTEEDKERTNQIRNGENPRNIHEIVNEYMKVGWTSQRRDE